MPGRAIDFLLPEYLLIQYELPPVPGDFAALRVITGLLIGNVSFTLLPDPGESLQYPE